MNGFKNTTFIAAVLIAVASASSAQPMVMGQQGMTGTQTQGSGAITTQFMTPQGAAPGAAVPTYAALVQNGQYITKPQLISNGQQDASQAASQQQQIPQQYAYTKQQQVFGADSSYNAVESPAPTATVTMTQLVTQTVFVPQSQVEQQQQQAASTPCPSASSLPSAAMSTDYDAEQQMDASANSGDAETEYSYNDDSTTSSGSIEGADSAAADTADGMSSSFGESEHDNGRLVQASTGAAGTTAASTTSSSDSDTLNACKWYEKYILHPRDCHKYGVPYKPVTQTRGTSTASSAASSTSNTARATKVPNSAVSAFMGAQAVQLGAIAAAALLLL